MYKVFQVKVITGASKNEVLLLSENMLRVKVVTPPLKGKANETVQALLADYFNVGKQAISIEKGNTKQYKVIHVDI